MGGVSFGDESAQAVPLVGSGEVIQNKVSIISSSVSILPRDTPQLSGNQLSNPVKFGGLSLKKIGGNAGPLLGGLGIQSGLLISG